MSDEHDRDGGAGAGHGLPLPPDADVVMLAPDLALLSFPLVEPVLPAPLTEAERDVVRLVLDGASNDGIARARGVSVKTVGNQLESVYRKVGVASRYELVLKLITPRGAR